MKDLHSHYCKLLQLKMPLIFWALCLTSWTFPPIHTKLFSFLNLWRSEKLYYIHSSLSWQKLSWFKLFLNHQCERCVPTIKEWLHSSQRMAVACDKALASNHISAWHKRLWGDGRHVPQACSDPADLRDTDTGKEDSSCAIEILFM